MIRTLVALAALLVGVPVHAIGGNVDVALLPEAAAVSGGDTLHVGIRMSIHPGWHVYWKNPGDSGLPPTVAWTLPPGFQAGPLQWPVPERFLEEEMMTYGYKDEVILPVAITAPAAVTGDSITIRAAIQWLECKDVCLPGSARVALRLPVSSTPAAATSDAPVIEAARRRLPGDAEGWSFQAEAGPRAIALTFAPPNGVRASGAYFYADQPLVTEYAEAQRLRGGYRVGTKAAYRLTLKPSVNGAGTPSRLTGVLAVGPTAVSVDVPVTPGDPALLDTRSGFPVRYLLFGLVLALAGMGLLYLRLRR